MGIRYAKLFEAAKSMFKSWDSHAVWTWLLLEKAWTGPWFACMTLHWKALRPWLIILPMLSFAKTMHAYKWPWGDVMTFESLTLTPFCFEKSSVRKWILMFKRRFQRGLCWNQVKYARITITHVCFIALTLAWSLGRCLNTRPNGLVFKQLPRDPANVNAWKNMYDPYNHYLCQILIEFHTVKAYLWNFQKFAIVFFFFFSEKTYIPHHSNQ